MHRSHHGFGGKVNEETGEMSYGFVSNLRDAFTREDFEARLADEWRDQIQNTHRLTFPEA